MTFVDVVVPLALPKMLTYHADEKQDLVSGHRVIVQVGNRQYTGIVFLVHKNAPNYKTKPILSILDQKPIVQKEQLELWSWISRYYMCSLGELMIAGIPHSLKLQSDTHYISKVNFEEEELSKLKENEQLILEALHHNERLNLSDISSILGVKFPQKYLKSLLEQEKIALYEELSDSYKPKKISKIGLSPDLKNDENAMKLVFEKLSRAPQQEALFLQFLHHYQDVGEKPILQKKLLQTTEKSPAVLKGLIDKEVLVKIEEEIGRIVSYKGEVKKLPNLSSLQNTVLEDVKSNFDNHQKVLLHGVTGSGKTEIYIHLIQEQINQKRKVLYLLPEIAITTQIIQRLQSYFGNRVGIYHSRFSMAERTELWYDLLEEKFNKYDIILGARSAVFLPLKNLGLIIVDEEHEQSYKQFNPAPRYHAREVASKLAQIHQANLLLGSATPSIEMMHLVKQNRIAYVSLKERFHKVPMPEIQCADLKRAHQKKEMKGSFSALLLEHIENTLKVNKQVILFQNRRGYAPRQLCTSCGWVPMCKKCDVSMTLHKYQPIMKCHYCGYTTPKVEKCGACGSHEVKQIGLGTQKIEEEIIQHFGNKYNVKRMDWDTTRKKDSFQLIIDQFEQKEIDILIGTQMVSKGLDFEHVGLVGVLQADDLLYYPDFRAFERCFQLLTQVSGRSGRKNERGMVIMQSFDPHHWILQKIMEYNDEAFYTQELSDRKHFKYPPFYHLINLLLLHKKVEVLSDGSRELGKRLRQKLGGRVMGPEFTIIPRINTYYQHQFVIKLEKDLSYSKVKQYISEVIDKWNAEKAYKAIRVKIDVDPM